MKRLSSRIAEGSAGDGARIGIKKINGVDLSEGDIELN